MVEVIAAHWYSNRQLLGRASGELLPVPRLFRTNRRQPLVAQVVLAEAMQHSSHAFSGHKLWAVLRALLWIEYHADVAKWHGYEVLSDGIVDLAYQTRLRRGPNAPKWRPPWHIRRYFSRQQRAHEFRVTFGGRR
jgi:hypothetical protein